MVAAHAVRLPGEAAADEAPAVEVAAARRGTAEPATPARPGLDLRFVVELVGAVAAPTTLLGGLAVYFGVVYMPAQAFYFGIDGSTLGLSAQDYVLRSVDALFVPLVVLGAAGIVLL